MDPGGLGPKRTLWQVNCGNQESPSKTTQDPMPGFTKLPEGSNPHQLLVLHSAFLSRLQSHFSG